LTSGSANIVIRSRARCSGLPAVQSARECPIGELHAVALCPPPGDAAQHIRIGVVRAGRADDADGPAGRQGVGKKRGHEIPPMRNDGRRHLGPRHRRPLWRCSAGAYRTHVRCPPTLSVATRRQVQAQEIYRTLRAPTSASVEEMRPRRCVTERALWVAYRHVAPMAVARMIGYRHL
jgi:hypothetical protein